MTIGRLGFLFVLLISLISPPLGLGQVDYSTATVRGTVSDPQHLLVAAAGVTITNPTTGFSRTMTTGPDVE